MISERVFLAFETGRGLAYVQPSGWQRAYLLWTFRNFRGLPHKILNARQRQLVETLYRTASPKLAHQDDDALIGTIEDFSLLSHDLVPDTAAAKESGIPAKKSGDSSISNQSEPLRSFYDRLDLGRLTRTAGAWALVAVMAFLGWQQWRTRPVVSASAPPSATVAHPRDEARPVDDRVKEIVSATVPPQTNTQEQTLPLSQMASAAPVTATPLLAVSAPALTASQLPRAFQDSPQNSPQDSARDTQQATAQASSRSGLNQPALSPHRRVPEPAGAQDATAALPRVQISGPPRKLVYPVSPDGSTRGKVSLQAVVGSDGKVSQVRVLTGNRLLAAAATDAIRQWRYQPFSKDAQKLERETRITVAFISSDVVAVSFPDTAPVSQ